MKLHLGSGKNIFDGWVNVDIDSRANVICDLSKGKLPFSTSSVNVIYSEHFIEHITRDQGIDFLKECHRVLKTGGNIRISTPDMKTIFEEYSAKRTDKWKELLFTPKTPCQMVNESMRNWGHLFIYDFEELKEIFLLAGFNNIESKDWRSSNISELTNLETRPFCGDLIVEATK